MIADLKPSLKPPKHLSPESRRWWQAVMEAYEIPPHSVRTVTACCESWDLAEQAREAIAAEGLLLKDRFNQTIPHPAEAVLRNAKALYLRSLRELNLSPAPEDPRSVRIR